MATWDLFNSEDKLLDLTPFFVKFTEKKNMEIRGKDSIWEPRVLFTCNMKAQNSPRFSRIS